MAGHVHEVYADCDILLADQFTFKKPEKCIIICFVTSLVNSLGFSTSVWIIWFGICCLH